MVLVKKRGWLALFFITVMILLACAASAEEAAALQVGDIVYLGAYEQDNNTDNGTETIAWQVLAVEENRVLLLSRNALDCQVFSTEQEHASWADSSLRTWLNDTFLTSAFTETEQGAILSSSVTNGISSAETTDWLFLLSYDETAAYFADADSRKATGSEYARANGAKFLGFTTFIISETDWWLRSAGTDAGQVSYVDVKGAIGSKAATDKVGVRPAMWLDTTVDRSYFRYEQYTAALQAEEEARYGDAATIYESLGIYNGCATKAKSSYYQQALAAMNDGDTANALRIFESLGDYEDSYVNGRACRYALAVAAQESGDNENAVKLFDKVGQYEDSMTRLKACFEKLGTSVYYFSSDVVNAGVDTGYAKTDVITGSDKHFGWQLGNFFMTGFTRVINQDTDEPVFIKTLGDAVTLRFDLAQNIDALNGNDKLVIGEDSNGYDQSFGVSKTNFGRGTLIVRHTDYQNRQGETQIYTDYLLAKGTTGADTKIVLNEEGDYEIALDYELHDNELTHITSKYANYRIVLRFSVRNGNCMVYPFDVLTGAELQNTSVTENGFYLDLARSRYLDIDVKRSVIVEGPTGMIEDERFNRPAKDGDQYTAEGIYTISVSNRYTGESTVKTIFVGSEELLQQYVENGFSRDRLN